MTPSNPTYPFSAIVGQERLKKALLVCAVNPGISGLLIRGEKGTAKSTAVRALGALLPVLQVVEGCPCGCDPSRPLKWCDACRTRQSPLPAASRQVPVVTLPLNATEDRILGGIDFNRAVRDGERSFEPGLLARANRGILYVDEVNLLDDHLVDSVLDAAATGINRVEREGISVNHPARFVLIGTMNPEEGELRPQFLDRFGLCVDIAGEKEATLRTELMKRREAFDHDPSGFRETWQEQNRTLSDLVVQARHLLPRVRVSTDQREEIADLCRKACVSGHRADLHMEQCAKTIAALEERTSLSKEDIKQAAEFVLPHRMRQPETKPPPPQPRPDKAPSPGSTQSPGESAEPKGNSPNSPSRKPDKHEHDSGGQGALEERIFAIGQSFAVKRIETRKDRLARRGSGRRSHTRAAQKVGRYARSRMADDVTDLALDATLRAAAPFQKQRNPSAMAVEIHSTDIRKKIRQRRIGNFIVFAVDASGSMGAKKRMISTKGAIMSLLMDAYRMRDRIAMVMFRKNRAEVLLPPTNSISVASRLLETLPTGGKTPLSAGLAKAFTMARTRLYKDPFVRPIIIVITDGRGNVPLNETAKPVSEALAIAGKMAEESRITYVVVDTESDKFMNFGLAGQLAQSLHATHHTIENLGVEDLVRVVKESNHA